MKSQLPPVAPKGSSAVMQAFNDLRQYIIERQVADVQGIVLSKSIITTPSGKIVQWSSLSGDQLGNGGPPPPIFGACCVGGVCSITASDACPGGFCGADTTCDTVTCDGDDCTPSDGEGACCNQGDCTIATTGDCYDSGGTPQGAGSSCEDAGVCDMPDCACGFSAHDGSDRKFLNRTAIGSLSFSSSGECGCIEVTIDYQADAVMSEAGPCISSESCSGTAHGHADNPRPQCGFEAEPCDCDLSLGGDCVWSGCPGCFDCGTNINFWLAGLHDYCGTPLATCDSTCSATHCDNTEHWLGEDPTDFIINEYLSNECQPV